MGAVWRHLRALGAVKGSNSKLQISRRDREAKRVDNSRTIIWAKADKHQQTEARNRGSHFHLKVEPHSTCWPNLRNNPQPSSLLPGCRVSVQTLVLATTTGLIIGRHNRLPSRLIRSLRNRASHGKTSSAHKHHRVATWPQELLGSNRPNRTTPNKSSTR